MIEVVLLHALYLLNDLRQFGRFYDEFHYQLIHQYFPLEDSDGFFVYHWVPDIENNFKGICLYFEHFGDLIQLEHDPSWSLEIIVKGLVYELLSFENLHFGYKFLCNKMNLNASLTILNSETLFFRLRLEQYKFSVWEV